VQAKEEITRRLSRRPGRRTRRGDALSTMRSPAGTGRLVMAWCRT
jgi:hypothetical protein